MKWGTDTMGWTADDIPDLTGKNAVVTGGNGGLGLATVTALARHGAYVIMAARNQVKAHGARAAILKSNPDAEVDIVDLDLGSLQAIEAAAAQMLEKSPAIDILVNNAGLMALPEGRTADGFETQFGVNHLGHWALTARLLPGIVAAPGARVVTVTSTAHHMGRSVDPRNPHLEGSYGPWKAYGQSKLANFHFAIGLQREFQGHRIDAASLLAHPGLSHTNLQVHTVEEGGGGRSAPFWEWLAATTGMEPDQGALPQLRAATDPAARGGEFYAPMFGTNGAPVTRPILRRIGLDSAIEKLWAVSETETGIRLDFGAAVTGRNGGD